MQKSTTATLLVAITLLGLLVLPMNEAAHGSGPSLVGLWFDTPSLSWARPTAAQSKAVTPCGPAGGLLPVATTATVHTTATIGPAATTTTSTAVTVPPATPGVCNPIPNAPNQAPVAPSYFTFSATAPEAFQLAGDLGATVWFSANKTTPWEGFRIELLNGTTVVATFNGSLPRLPTGSPAATLNVTPLKFSIGGSLVSNQGWRAGDTINLRITVFGVSTTAHPQGANIRFHFGGVNHTSGITFVTRQPFSYHLGQGIARIHLADNSLTYTYPGGTARTRLHQRSNVLTPTVLSAPEWEWGKVQTVTEFTLRSNPTLNVTLQVRTSGTNGNVNASIHFALGASLWANGTKIASGITPTTVVPMTCTTTCSSTAFVRDVVSLNLAGNPTVKAGNQIALKFQIFSSEASDVKISFVYGSAKYPSGLVFAYDGEAPAAPLPTSATSPTTSTTTSKTTNATTNTTNTTAARPKAIQTEPTPGLPVWAALAATSVIVVALRRRREADPPPPRP